MAYGHQVPMKGIISARADWGVAGIEGLWEGANEPIATGTEVPAKGCGHEVPVGDWHTRTTIYAATQYADDCDAPSPRMGRGVPNDSEAG